MGMILSDNHSFMWQSIHLTKLYTSSSGNDGANIAFIEEEAYRPFPKCRTSEAAMSLIGLGLHSSSASTRSDFDFRCNTLSSLQMTLFVKIECHINIYLKICSYPNSKFAPLI